MDLTQGAQHVLAHGGIIVTANPRAARHLHRVYDQRQSLAGHSAWRTPKILPLNAWLEETWNSLVIRGVEDRLLLSPIAAEEIWVRVLNEAGAAARVLTVRGLATTAADAWRLLWSYGGMKHLRSFAAYGDAREFVSWAEQYLKLCSQNKWIDAARLPDAITSAITSGHVTVPSTMLFCGFDRATPAISRLISAFKQSGCEIELADFASESTAPSTPATPSTPAMPSTTTLRVVSGHNQTSEIETLAEWCRLALIHNPAMRIAVVVPNLNTMRDEIDHIFQRVLAPASRGILARDSFLPYEFSLGTPLAQHAMVRSALLLLEWSHASISLDDISWLLNCEYSGDGDLWSRGRADAELRSRGKSLRLDANMRWTINALGTSRSRWLPILQRLDHIATTSRLNNTSHRASYMNWIEEVENYLSAAQWPGPDTPDSVEFQVKKRWQTLLSSIAQLDASLPRVSFTQAFAVIKRNAEAMLFTPESHDTPIQIMGALESAGVAADRVWFAGVDELAWPALRRPNPLLSIALQRTLQMPGANLEIDSAFAAAVSRRIFDSAPLAIASFARRKDEAELSLSAPIKSLTSELLRAEEMPQPSADRSASDTLPVLDHSHVPWLEQRPAGGADVLEKQAACPFRAFASRRLRIRPLSEMEEGLGAGDRGNLVHKVMEEFWSELQNQSHLLSLGEAGSLATLEKHIITALDKHQVADEWSAAFLAAEFDRLKKVLSTWLQVERDRSPFEVTSQEQNSQQTLGPLTLSVRMDRVDKTPFGTVVLDYKTGKARIEDWEGDRPDKPQLPLYALSVHDLAGLGFGRVSAEKNDIVGYQAEAGVFFPAQDQRTGKLTQPLAEIVTEWMDVLTQLAEEFAAGEASVNPKNGKKTCEYCGLETLCRIAEDGTGDEQEVNA